MPKFAGNSLLQLATCATDLQLIAMAAIEYVDFSIIEGHRDQAAQHADFIARPQRSQLDWPHGRHNAIPSNAFDFSPYPADWSDKATALGRFTFVAGVIWTVAKQHGIAIRFGWDWNQNLDPRDETFLDWGHVELINPSRGSSPQVNA